METIADIVREMLEMVENVTDSEGFRPAWAVYFEGFAERIEDAYERRLIASMDFLADKCAKVKSECERENAVLKAALKPILAYKFNDVDEGPDEFGSWEVSKQMWVSADLIREAQRIVLEAWGDRNYFWKGDAK